MLDVCASYVGSVSENDPLPAPILTASHEDCIGNDVLFTFPAVACTPSMYLMIVTVTSGNGPLQGPLRSGVVSQVEKSTLVDTLSPVPGPTGPGPLALPHQLQVASNICGVTS